MRASDKVSVAVGAPRSTRKPLSFDHMTTLGFFQIQPMMYHEMVVDEKIKGESVCFTRSYPMVSPVMTSIKYNYSKFFVRYKDVWPAWDDFDAKAIHYFASSQVSRIPTSVPHVFNNEFVLYFLNAQTSGGTPLLCIQDNTNPDFIYYDGENSQGYSYTTRGKYLMKILNSFGIILHWNSSVDVPISLLPLLCYAKCFCDWYVPNQYVNSNTGIRMMQNVFTTDSHLTEALPYSEPSDSTHPYTNFLILFCNTPFYITFDDNDLYSAWDNVSGPTQGSISTIVMPDITNGNAGQIVSNHPGGSDTPSSPLFKPTNGTAYVGGSSSTDITNTSGVLTQYVLDSLRHVSNVVRRAQLVGERTVDRFLAKYGVKLKDDHRSMLLGQETQYLNIGDVEATADSTDGSVYSNVGDLAGKGVTLGKVNYDAAAGSHSGLFMILCTTIPDTSLVQGFDPMWLHVEPDQFYNPDFDHLGTDAIPHMAVFVPNDGSKADSPLGVYGYLPRYYEYLLNRTLLTGTFTYPSSGAAELSSYHTYRMIPEQNQSNIVHSLDFVIPDNTSIGLLNRIYYSNSLEDTFILHFKSTFVSNSSKRPLKDVYDWGEDEKNGMLDLQSTNAKVH